MDKKRLTILLDVMIALVMVWMVQNDLFVPAERSLAGFMENNVRRGFQRAGASELWLIAIWLGMYRPWDRAIRISSAVAALGAGLALCVLGTGFFTSLIINSYIARFSQMVYGGWMLLTLVVCWFMQLALERVNADAPGCVAASRRWRRALSVAIGLLCAGMAVCAIRYTQAMWYSVGAAALAMLAMTVFSDAKKADA